MQLKYTYERDEGGECDCCGSYFGETKRILLDGEEVWYHDTDGHLGRSSSEKDILHSILDAWRDIELERYELLLSEECRGGWNKQYVGNSVARTPESWKEHVQEMIDCLNADYGYLLEDCENLPYDEALKMKMIALWLEERIGEAVEVICEG